MTALGRRGFLGGLGTLLATAALDPERLLWVPGKKTISIPKPIRRAKLFTYSSVGDHFYSFASDTSIGMGPSTVYGICHENQIQDIRNQYPSGASFREIPYIGNEKRYELMAPGSFMNIPFREMS
jgi:hypothetical protein